MKRRAIWWGATALLTVGVIAPALARPGYLMAFKAHYNTAQGKPNLNGANCALCHVGAPPQGMFNVYGSALKANLNGMTQVNAARINEAFTAVEGRMNPATNQTFRAMINGDRFPGSTQGAAGGGAGGATLGNSPWEPVFNNVNMDGLTKMGEGNWVVQDGVLKYTGGGRGWLRGNKQYNNYAMVVVWRWTTPNASNDAGVFLKAKPGDNGSPFPNSPQLMIGTGQEYGSIGGAQGTRGRGDLIKMNDWNVYAITVQNGLASMAINGQTAWDTGVHPGLAGPGFVGIQNENFPIEIAQWWIRPLP